MKGNDQNIRVLMTFFGGVICGFFDTGCPKTKAYFLLNTTLLGLVLVMLLSNCTICVCVCAILLTNTKILLILVLYLQVLLILEMELSGFFVQHHRWWVNVFKQRIMVLCNCKLGG